MNRHQSSYKSAYTYILVFLSFIGKFLSRPSESATQRSRLSACLVIAFFLVSCHSDSGKSSQSPRTKPVSIQHLKLQAADNCDDLKSYIQQSLIGQYATIPSHTQYFYCPQPVNTGGGGEAGAPPPDAAAPGAESGDSVDSSTPGDVSDTNNQEQGVNEGDIVKADSNGNIYILTGRHFIIAKGFPPNEMQELARLDLGGRGLNLFLDETNHKVVILARHDEPFYITDTAPGAEDEAQSVIYPKPESDYSVAIFYDISNPAQPQLVDQIQMQGYYREGRRIENRLHLVANHYLRPIGLFEDAEFRDLYSAFNQAVYQARCADPDGNLSTDPVVLAAQEKLVGKISNIVSTTDPSSYLPKAFRVNNGTSTEIEYLQCTDINFPEIKKTLGLQVVTSVDTDAQNLGATAIVTNSYIAYASQDNLYLADTSQGWWWIADDGSLPSSQTAIYKFSISGSAPQYLATGRIDGYANNQFSFSEFEGALRVATTQDDWFINEDSQWQRYLSNHLSVLVDNGEGELQLAGAVKDFIRDETIRSARFMGSKGFVVTFRNVDPLFTFDLSNPQKPALLGELHITGFSTYIHPYDENHLLTIGRAAGEGGIGGGSGIQLQIIDVSDMSNPRLAKSFKPSMPDGWSWSDAEYDHKAFTFYKPANLLAIPLQISPASNSNEYFSGMVAYNVSLNLEKGFEEIGRVDHKDLSYQYYCAGDSGLLPDYLLNCENGWYMQWSSPRRSIVMTDVSDIYLYTLSDVGLKASSISDLSTAIGSMVFPVQPYPWWRFGYYPVGVTDPMPMIEPVF